MVFGRRQGLASQNSNTFDPNVHGQSIKRTNAFKYLGVISDIVYSFTTADGATDLPMKSLPVWVDSQILM